MLGAVLVVTSLTRSIRYVVRVGGVGTGSLSPTRVSVERSLRGAAFGIWHFPPLRGYRVMRYWGCFSRSGGREAQVVAVGEISCYHRLRG